MNKLEGESKNNYNAMNGRVVGLENKVEVLDGRVETVSKMPGPRGYNGSRVSKPFVEYTYSGNINQF